MIRKVKKLMCLLLAVLLESTSNTEAATKAMVEIAKRLKREIDSKGIENFSTKVDIDFLLNVPQVRETIPTDTARNLSIVWAIQMYIHNEDSSANNNWKDKTTEQLLSMVLTATPYKTAALGSPYSNNTVGKAFSRDTLQGYYLKNVRLNGNLTHALNTIASFNFGKENGAANKKIRDTTSAFNAIKNAISAAYEIICEKVTLYPNFMENNVIEKEKSIEVKMTVAGQTKSATFSIEDNVYYKQCIINAVTTINSSNDIKSSIARAIVDALISGNINNVNTTTAFSVIKNIDPNDISKLPTITNQAAIAAKGTSGNVVNTANVAFIDMTNAYRLRLMGAMYAIATGQYIPSTDANAGNPLITHNTSGTRVIPWDCSGAVTADQMSLAAQNFRKIATSIEPAPKAE